MRLSRSRSISLSLSSLCCAPPPPSVSCQMFRAAVHSNDDALSLRPRTIMRLIVLAILGLIVLATCCVAKLSDKRLCYDKDCSEVISTGRTTIPYNPKDRDLLSFPANVEVKVLSKSAGSRPDLWGVEVNGRRGYVPKTFIRELKVLKNPKHIVPVETATNEPVQKDTSKSEVPAESVGNDSTGPAQVDESQAEVSKDEVSASNVEDTISLDEVTPVFQSIYDGTIIPQEIDEIEPVSPSVSIQAPQDSAKVEEDVQLNLYPNLLSSTIDTLSNIFASDDESEGESEENAESVELASSEKTQTEESTEKTPEIVEKPDESSHVPGEESEQLSTNADPEETAVEETIPEEEVEEFVPEAKAEETAPEVKNDESVQDGKVNESNLELEVNEIVSEIKNDEAVVEIQSETTVYPELQELYGKAEVDGDEIKNEDTKDTEETVEYEQEESSKERSVEEEKSTSDEKIEVVPPKEESVYQEPSLKDTIEVKEDVDVDVKTEPIENKSISDEAPASVETTTDEPFNIAAEVENVIKKAADNVPNEKTVYVTQNILEAEKEITESLPVQEAIPSDQKNVVNSNAFDTENNINTLVSSPEIVVDKQVDELKDILINSATVEESIIPEVPLKQETKEESVTPSSESFIPQLPLYQPNILSNDSISSQPNLKTSENLTVPHTLVEESKQVENQSVAESQQQVDINVGSNNNVVVDTSKPLYLQNDSSAENTDSSFLPVDSSRENVVDIPSTPSFGEFLGNRNLLNAGKGFQYDDHSAEIGVDKIVIDENVHSTVPSASDESLVNEVKQEDANISVEDVPIERNVEKVALPMDTCDINSDCSGDTLHQYTAEANAVTSARKMTEFNSETLLIVCITAVTTLLFSLGYYFLENRRRDAFLIAKINKLETNLMKTEKECSEMQDKFTTTKTKLDSIEDESFGSNEMVTSLKLELASSENMREELESQIASLEKELESTSEAGLELERMLREILSSQSEENNPLAQSIEELQTRLNDQQVANESLQAALTATTQDNENLTGDLTVSIKKIEQLQAEVTQMAAELKSAISTKNNLEESLSSKVQLLEIQVRSMSEDKNTLRKQLKLKELEVKELLDVVDKFNSDNLDFEKLYEVSRVKAEAAHLLEERDELRTKISDEEGARQLLEEHVRVVTEEVAFLSEQCKAAEKEKIDAKTQLEVLKHFFEEREAQRQREEKKWLEKQGEHSSTVERLQTMQNEILNYKQQIEMLKREILDQEKEYKNQIAVLEMKAHEQWVTARQNERRLEEIKAESSQLRNRLTLVEKNINETDPESKMHRLQAAQASNGESERITLYPGGETSTSPLMFVPGGPPPPLPPYHHLFPPPPFLHPPPPQENSRPPPLGGGRLSSPPPHQPSSASNPAASPPLSPPPHMFHHMPLPHDLLPPLPLPLSSTHNSWGDEPPPLPPNANAFRPHGFQRPRNHKGSLHSSGESMDKSHHSSKV